MKECESKKNQCSENLWLQLHKGGRQMIQLRSTENPSHPESSAIFDYLPFAVKHFDGQ